MRYFQDHVKPTKRFRAPTDTEREALSDLRARLDAWDGGADPEELQAIVYETGRAHGYENLRDWFRAIYEVLLGSPQGPRFGGFIALYGVPETVVLIDRALAGELVA